jgi:hypothetical protein
VARFAGVSIVPGSTVSAETLRSLFSSAMVRTNATSAAFEALYAPTMAPGSTACRLATTRIRPPPHNPNRR